MLSLDFLGYLKLYLDIPGFLILFYYISMSSNILRYIMTSWDMSGYCEIYLGILRSLQITGNIMKISKIFRDQKKYRDIKIFLEICWDIQIYPKIFQDIWKYNQWSLNTQRSFVKYLYILRYIRLYREISENIQRYQEKSCQIKICY